MHGEQRDEGCPILAQDRQEAALVGRQLDGPREQAASVRGVKLASRGQAGFLLLWAGIHNFMLRELIQVV